MRNLIFLSSQAEKEGSGLLLPGAQTGCYSHSIPPNGEGGPCSHQLMPMAQTGTGVALMPILRFWVLRLWVGHKGSPLHTALVERHKFLVLGGLPQQTVFWNQNLTHRNQQVKGGWLLLVCHFLDALQTF